MVSDRATATRLRAGLIVTIALLAAGCGPGPDPSGAAPPGQARSAADPVAPTSAAVPTPGAAASAATASATAATASGGAPPAVALGAPLAASAAASPPAVAAEGADHFDYGPVRSVGEYLAAPEFAGADLKNGQLLSLACAACHTFGAGEKTLIGPNLHGVFGRRAATLPGFDYSDALRATDLVWTPRSLEAWLADPSSFVAGTKMSFSGYRSPEDRRDLIAFLLRATE